MGIVNNVLIIGAGITGLTAAVALRRQGIAVDIIEIRPNVADQPGVGLSLQGNCLKALGEIGLAAACLREGMPANYINIRRPDGELIFRQQTPPTGGPAYAGTCGIRRRVLHEILLAGAKSCGVSLREGVTHRSLEQDETGVTVVLENGDSARYDVVIAADGYNSKVRQNLFPQCVPVFDRQVCWRAGIPRPKGTFTTEFHVGGTLGAVGICPVSVEDAYIYIVDSGERTTRHAGPEGIEAMIKVLETYSSPVVCEAVSYLRDSATLTYRPLESVLLDPPWHQGRVVLMGDAVHVGPPVLAQGAAMGIEDAVVFAEMAVGAQAIEPLMTAFVERRYPRASLVVRNSRQLCEWEVTHAATPQMIGQVMRETQIFLSKPY